MGRDIVIIPNRGLSGGTTHPEIRFSGLTDSSIKLKVEDDGSIVFDGNTGGLFEITDSKDGLLSAVSDVSGLPILAVYSDNRVVAGKWDDPGLTVINNQVFVGPTATTNASLYVSGNEEISGTLNIGTIGGGTPIGNLGFDSSGNVVTGTTGGGGEVNTASNVGVGQGVFKQKSGVDLQFYSLSGGNNTTLTLNGDTVVVDSSGGSSTTGSYTPNKYINTGGVTVPAIVGNHHIIDNGHPSNPTTYELPDTGTTIGDMIKFTVLDGVCRVKPINSQFLTYGNTATAVGAPVDITTASWFTLFEGESLEVVYVGSKNVGSSQKWIISNFSSFQVNDSVGTSRVGI